MDGRSKEQRSAQPRDRDVSAGTADVARASGEASGSLTKIQRSIAALLVLFAFACKPRETAQMTFENAPVILISIDTLRADHLRAYDAKGVAAPAIERLVKDGMLFENGYAHVPLTLPSHVTMLSGRLPYENGVRSNIGYRFEQDPGATLPRLLSQRGYATGAAVSAYVLRRSTGLGDLFDFYDDGMEVQTSAPLADVQRDGETTSQKALQWIDGLGDRPFFLMLHLFEPHTPYQPSYDRDIASADTIVGRFLEQLDRRGLYDRALIVLTSDHGEGLGDHGEAEHGLLLYREALHVPLILKFPQRKHAGKRVAAPAQLIDLLPTIASASGAKVPDGLPGTSLLALAEGRVPGDRAIYSETLYPRLHFGWSELRSFIDARSHYIESPSPELFDLTKDPQEKTNLTAERRRDARAFADRLKNIPLHLQSPQAVSEEERARLAALGYLSGGAPTGDGPLPNPRDRVQVEARIQRAFDLHLEGKVAESATLCREILAEEPRLVDVYLLLARNRRTEGKLDEALQAYRDAVRLSPQLVDSIAVDIATLELRRKDLEAAELNARQALALHPIDAHMILASIAEKRLDLATAEREARLAMAGENPPRVAAVTLTARILTMQGRYPEALELAQSATDRVGRGAQSVPTLAATRGDLLARMGQIAEAEAAFREEITRFPATTEAYVRLAVLLAQERRFKEITPLLEQMVQASPSQATYVLAAQTMKELGNTGGERSFLARGRALRD
jgi:tetratricopeptide (TPR) repeat protein